MCTKADVSPYLDKFREKQRRSTLSGAALETLAIIAYKQPITRLEAEAIRGVSIEGVIHTLLERRLVKIAGRKDVPGKPFLYRTTKEFLEHFGLNSLKDLPPIEELETLLKHYTESHYTGEDTENNIIEEIEETEDSDTQETTEPEPFEFEIESPDQIPPEDSEQL
jgi:segregation and condensation protein B